MIYETITVQAGEYEGTLGCFEYTESREMPTASRPAMLVLPGGGYAMCSDREAEPIALEFLTRGSNAYALRYPCAPAEYPAQLAVAAAAMDTIRKRKNGKTDGKRVFAIGFSAGGHLCASLANCDPSLPFLRGYDCKPNGVVLGYPVIGGTPTHGGSFDNLLGNPRPKGMEWLQLHESVRADNPPAFIWTTADDGAVPAVNSLRYAAAYAEKGIPYELHIYKHGAHGSSLCDERTSQVDPEHMLLPASVGWVDMADTFLRSL